MTQPIDYATPMTPGPRRIGRGLLGWILFIAVAALLFVWLKQSSPSNETVPLSAFYAQAKAGNISVTVVDGDEIDGQFRRPYRIGAITATRFHTRAPDRHQWEFWSFTQWLLNIDPTMVVRAEGTNNILTNFVLPFIPWLLILGFIWFFVFRRLRPNNAQPRQPMPVVIVNPEAR